MSKILHIVSKMTWGTWTQLRYLRRNQPSHCAILMKLGVWYWVDHRLMHMLWICSYLLCEVNSQNEFITLNLSKFGAFLTIWSWIQIFGQCQKCSDCAHIWCDEFFSWVDFINKIWAQSEHFWQLPKFWT